MKKIFVHVFCRVSGFSRCSHFRMSRLERSEDPLSPKDDFASQGLRQMCEAAAMAVAMSAAMQAGVSCHKCNLMPTLMIILESFLCASRR